MTTTNKLNIVIKSEYVTGYALTNIVNELLTNKVMKPQQVYNYMKNGLIKATEVGGQKVVSRQDAIVWLTKYVTKHNA